MSSYARVEQLPIEAVLFDLDDTLVPQAAWLEGAWRAVAGEAVRLAGRSGRTIDAEEFATTLAGFAAEGSARGGIIDRAVAAAAPGLEVAPLVAAFRTYRAPTLSPYPGAIDAVGKCRSAVPIALVSDGDAEIQRAKIEAAGLSGMFDVVVLSDEFGREHRKPDPLPFRTALEALGVPPERAAFIGDRPGTDISGAVRLGMRAVRVRTGEYADLANEETPAADVADVVAAVEWLFR